MSSVLFLLICQCLVMHSVIPWKLGKTSNEKKPNDVRFTKKDLDELFNYGKQGNDYMNDNLDLEVEEFEIVKKPEPKPRIQGCRMY